MGHSEVEAAGEEAAEERDVARLLRGRLRHELRVRGAPDARGELPVGRCEEGEADEAGGRAAVGAIGASADRLLSSPVLRPFG